MRRASPLLAAVVVLLANGSALLNVAGNRAGEPEAEAWLTERELPLATGSGGSAGVFLRLDWQRCSTPCTTGSLPWLDRARLEALGFDCRTAPDSAGARDRYQRMLPRPAFVVLEHDGPAWQRWLEAARDRPAAAGEGPRSPSRLVPIDAGPDPAELRRRHPDRARFLIVPGVVAAGVELAGAGREARLVVLGRIERLAVRPVHVPREKAAPLAGLRPAPVGEPRYAVRLRYGPRHEPWVVEVASPPAALP